ncbi:MAG: LytR/AlgR family response regulator transcription factor [Gemmatimonadota bacterium]
MSERADATFRVLIVDDEPLARERLRTLLADDPEVEVAGECGDGASAVDAVRESRPDLVLLDVQMPELDGFEVVAEVGAEAMPPVIFVTAYDEYAIRAFDVHALDYLLKPFERERFERALRRAKAHLARGNERALTNRLRKLLAEVRPGERTEDEIDRLVIRSRGRVTIVPLEEVEWIAAAGNYVRLHLDEGSHLMRETMERMTERLPPDEFLRVSRSAIVRIARIRELKRLSHGEYTIVLRDGTEVKSSRSYSDDIEGLLGGDR